MTNKAEDLLSDFLRFGYEPTAKNSHLHIPTLWEIAHDLNDYVKDGTLIELPLNCSLHEIFEAENFWNSKPRRYHHLMEIEYFGQSMKTLFKSVPGNTLYELVFSKSEKSAHCGYFKKLGPADEVGLIVDAN